MQNIFKKQRDSGLEDTDIPCSGTNTQVRESYHRYVGKKLVFLVSMLVLVTLLSAFIVTIGPLDISIPDVYKILISSLFPGYFVSEELPSQIVWNIRLPRIVAGIMAGFGLGICGCVMQAVLKNPLASPFTLGISSGANFGVAVAAVMGVGVIGGPYLMVGNAFLFAMLCALFIIALASFKGATSETLILAGIAINYLFGSLSDLFRYFATDEQLRVMVSWGMGDLSAFSWSNFALLLGVFVFCTPLLYLKANDLNIMAIGDENAKSLGIDANRVRMFSMLLASLLIATVVCFTGTIAFIGLVAPHMARMVIGSDHKYLFPASGLLGALILISADATGMNILRPTMIPTGIMTSLLGVPFFMYLILKKKKKEFW
ncbi:iron ABC transporter permease [Methanococcoides methylutens]|uniref:Cobalamin import system permease protein BtuC n=1 Tax=Methanococcoides methylutens MM1 TaxID=1434104 RepID=A0A0E3X0C6_METMT|nr:iron ABC transporter permease [Methanococcoides methylutens]AKB85474.1 Iron(III) dicitrate transport system permease protein FecD [Methanococcoides methylutens MM1]